MPIWWVVIEISAQNLLHRVSILTVSVYFNQDLFERNSLGIRFSLEDKINIQLHIDKVDLYVQHLQMNVDIIG